MIRHFSTVHLTSINNISRLFKKVFVGILIGWCYCCKVTSSFLFPLRSNQRHNQDTGRVPVPDYFIRSTTVLRKGDYLHKMTKTSGDQYDSVLRHTSPLLLDDVANEQPNASRVALVILNTPSISKPPSSLFKKFWTMSSFRVCADGGANRLYDATIGDDDNQSGTVAVVDDDSAGNNKKDDNQYIPHYIRGDLDSLRQDVRSYYESKGSIIERDPDQDTNDLDKALQIIRQKEEENNDNNNDDHKQQQSSLQVLVYGGFGGRFDQEMASIQALYKWSNVFNYNLSLYDDETCAFLLPPLVKNEIKLLHYGEHTAAAATTISSTSSSSQRDVQIVGDGPTCGLIPIGCRCDYVKTTGFKWNLDGTMPLEFGGIVSTSNRIMKEIATVESSQPLIFTAEISSLDTIR